jgi:FMN phosphatase YigB (HAD superfamily)
MAERSLRYATVLFDWGDTVMRDDPASLVPMVEWETVEVVEGVADVLEYLRSSGRQIVLATSASISEEGQIRGALRRGGLDAYFSKIYCFKNIHLPKGEDFYRCVLKDLDISPSDALMIGDGFENDIRAANAVGIFAVWFNPRTTETRSGKLHTTIPSMQGLHGFFRTLDQE